MTLDCFECGATIAGDDLAGLAEAFLAHARADHDWPYPDQAIRNYAEATQRLTGGAERLPEIGAIEIHPVTEERIDDWLAFFDHDGFVGRPEWAGCYCLAPHQPPMPPDQVEVRHWTVPRAEMVERLRAGTSFGYLAYVDGRPAGWVNASRRSDEAAFRGGPAAEPPDEAVIGVACFVIAPPYRRHGVAGALLDRVIADAPGPSAGWVEGYPFRAEVEPAGDRSFRGTRAMYEERGFQQVASRELDVVMRRPVP